MTTSRPSSITSSAEPRSRGLLDGTWVVFCLGPLALLRGRRALGLFLLVTLPMLPVVFSLLTESGRLRGLIAYTSYLSRFYFDVVNLLVCLFLGCAALGDDIEGRTIPYLLTRALPRAALVLGRYLTYLACAGLVLVLAYVVQYLLFIAPMGATALRIDLPYLGAALVCMLLAVAAHGAVFMALSVLFKKPILVGLGISFLFGFWASKAPGRIPTYTINYHVMSLFGRWTELTPAIRAAGDAQRVGDLQTSAQALSALLFVIVTSLLVASFAFRRKEYTF